MNYPVQGIHGARVQSEIELENTTTLKEAFKLHDTIVRQTMQKLVVKMKKEQNAAKLALAQPGMPGLDGLGGIGGLNPPDLLDLLLSRKPQG